MPLSDLHKILAEPPVPPLILLYGAENYFVEQGWQAVRDAVVPSDSRDFNLTVFHGKDLQSSAVIEQALTLPIFTAQRLVVVKNLHEARADQLDGLLDYVADPVPETVLLLTAEKIDARRKLFQVLKKNGVAIEFKAIYDNQLPGFVRQVATQHRLTLTAEALRLFCKRVGTNLAAVAGEMEKLAGYLGERDLAEHDDVAAIVSDTRIESIFDLTDAMGQGDRSTALQLLDRLLAEGQPPLMVLAMMTRHFRQMWKISALTEQRVPAKDLPRQVGVSPYFLKGLMQQAARFDTASYREVFARFLQTDLALKSSGSEPALLLEQLVLAITALCSTKRGAS
ncbi:MAG: DNA polymerase III subunit delta [Desulfuromonadales bacterium]